MGNFSHVTIPEFSTISLALKTEGNACFWLLTMQREDKRNALSKKMLGEIAQALEWLQQQPGHAHGAHSLVLMGQG